LRKVALKENVIYGFRLAAYTTEGTPLPTSPLQCSSSLQLIMKYLPKKDFDL
jgi:hypothetical protein